MSVLVISFIIFFQLSSQLLQFLLPQCFYTAGMGVIVADGLSCRRQRAPNQGSTPFGLTLGK